MALLVPKRNIPEVMVCFAADFHLSPDELVRCPKQGKAALSVQLYKLHVQSRGTSISYFFKHFVTQNEPLILLALSIMKIARTYNHLVIVTEDVMELGILHVSDRLQQQYGVSSTMEEMHGNSYFDISPK